MLLSVMTILKKTLSYLVAGFIAQLIIFFAAMGLAEADIFTNKRLWSVLLPGIELFAMEGVHSTKTLSGLRLALAFNAVVYAVAIFALHSLFMGIRKEGAFR